MNSLTPQKQIAVLKALTEGVSIRSTERMTGVHRDTIMRLTIRAGWVAQEILDDTMRDLDLRDLQVDEIWSFVRKKQKQVSETDADAEDIGDQYICVALDRDTKLIPAFTVGKRTAETTQAFVENLRTRLNGNRPQLTSDGFKPYIEAVDLAWGGDIDYAQLVKVYGGNGDDKKEGYSPCDFVGTMLSIIFGNPDKARICTSHVERQNLTIRMAVRRLTRLTNAFSKKLENLIAALSLHFWHYNFMRVHQTLRVT
ncbi:IS1 family transposase, partial [Candidatus Sumerlaeota bacterium]|nr:IS1 family transposase [Candidatus Sumerlaeota bacterium]